MDDIRVRVDRLVREFVSAHLPPLIGMMAEAGVERSVQKERVDRFVRALLEYRLEASLERQGRRIVCEIDDSREPPVIHFNGELLGRVDDEEILGVFQKPVVNFLDVSPVNAALVLQIRDKDKLKSLYKRAAGALEVEPVDITDVPAVLEERLRLLSERVDEMTEALAQRATEASEDVAAGLDSLREQSEVVWPGWEEVQTNPYIDRLIDDVRDSIRGVSGMPKAKTLVELCWESLDLSTQSFLRHAARQLRSERDQDIDIERVLRVLAGVVTDRDVEVSEDVTAWPNFEQLADTWAQLFRNEQRLLAWTSEGRRTPPLSVFEPPIDSLHLNEPESLPWEFPLLSWSMREKKALRDLLEGQRRTLEGEMKNRFWLNIDLEVDPPGSRLAMAEKPVDFAFQAATFRVDSAEAYRKRTRRAVRGYFKTMLAQFDALNEEHQYRLLQRLRASYDGYFSHSKPVWDRRFQAWKHLNPRRAFTLLTTELQHLIGATALFDPFEAPDALRVRSIPTFNFVLAWPRQRTKARTRVPLVALKCAFKDAPARVRVIEVPEEPNRSCRWLGDQELTLRTLVQQPTEKLMKAIESDAVGLMIARKG